MISLHCTKCKALLEMDDGFAGGVCRCQFCKTIQTVPSKRKEGATSPSAKPSKSASNKPGSGLDELAEVVASSGLARGSLSKPAKVKTDTSAAETNVKKRNPLLLALIAAGVVVVVLVGVVVYLVVRPTPDTPGNPAKKLSDEPIVSGVAVPSDAGGDSPASIASASFANAALPGGPTIYLIDQSQANDEFLAAAKAATFKSILSLGPAQKFQIIFWKRESEDVISYPETGFAAATKAETDKAAKQFEDVVAYGSTDLQAAFEKAVAAQPAAIVLMTAKSFLGDEVLLMMHAAKKTAPVKIYTFAFGESENPILKQVAEQTGGTYHELSLQKLRASAQ